MLFAFRALHFHFEGSAIAKVAENRTACDFSCRNIDCGLDLTHHLSPSFTDIGLTQSKRKWNRRTSHASSLKRCVESHGQNAFRRATVTQDSRHFDQSAKLLLRLVIPLECLHHLVNASLSLLLRHLGHIYSGCRSMLSCAPKFPIASCYWRKRDPWAGQLQKKQT